MQNGIEKEIQKINLTLQEYKSGNYTALKDLLQFMKESSAYLDKKASK